MAGGSGNVNAVAAAPAAFCALCAPPARRAISKVSPAICRLSLLVSPSSIASRTDVAGGTHWAARAASSTPYNSSSVGKSARSSGATPK